MVVHIEKEKESKINFFNWLWNSESILSYIVFLIIVFIFVKFVFLPGLSLAFGMGLNGLPLAIVESSSMDHNAVKYCLDIPKCTVKSQDYEVCGKKFSESKYLNLEEYWNTCGKWYENKNISNNQFASFSLKNGFRKGDLIVIFKKKEIKIGDVIVFHSGQPTPIIHRVISLNPIQTKGDHNSDQIGINPDPRNIDETRINESQIIGTAVAKIPYLGWVKLFFVESWKKIKY